VSTGIPATRMTMQSRAVRALLPMAYRMVRHLFSTIRHGAAASAAVRETRGRVGCLTVPTRDPGEWDPLPDTISLWHVQIPRSKPRNDL
jgi:hypothetical protein